MLLAIFTNRKYQIVLTMSTMPDDIAIAIAPNTIWSIKSGGIVPTVPIIAPNRRDMAGRDAPLMQAHMHSIMNHTTSDLVKYRKSVDKLAWVV